MTLSDLENDLGEMLPDFALADHADEAFRDSMLFREFASQAVATLRRPDGQDIGVSQLGIPLEHTTPNFSGIVGPTLGDFIVGIIKRRADEQVCRIHTGRIVTTVQNMRAGWNRSMHQHPYKPVHVPIADTAIAGRGATARPVDAILRHGWQYSTLRVLDEMEIVG